MEHVPNLVQAILGDANNPTIEELIFLDMGLSIFPGKQCPHAADTWFQDPRPNLPPLRSRSSIWREIVRDSDRPRSKQDKLISSYVSGDNKSLLESEAKAEQEFIEIALKRFPDLPRELKDAIFEKARHPRLLDLLRLSYSWYIHRGPPPVGASVDHASRERALKMVVPSTKIRHVMNDGELDFNHFTSHDIVLYPSQQLVLHNGALEPTLFLPNLLQSKTVVIHWQMLRLTARSIRLTEDIASALDQDDPRAEMEARFHNESFDLRRFILCYRFLLNLEHMKTLGVSLRKTHGYEQGVRFYVDANLEASEERCQDRDKISEPSVETLVDLYDDNRLAEVTSLGSHLREANSQPRYSLHHDHPYTGTLCLNCERVQWETLYKERAEKIWVMLHADEVLDLDSPNFERQPAWRKLFYPFHKPLPKNDP